MYYCSQRRGYTLFTSILSTFSCIPLAKANGSEVSVYRPPPTWAWNYRVNFSLFKIISLLVDFPHQDFQIYYLHHLLSVYTLFNSEAFDTWSTRASAIICRLFFDIICIFPKRRWRCPYRRVVFKPWFHAVLPAFLTLDKYWCAISRYTDRFHYILGPDNEYDSNNE